MPHRNAQLFKNSIVEKKLNKIDEEKHWKLKSKTKSIKYKLNNKILIPEQGNIIKNT